MDPGGKIYTIDEFRCWKVENLDDEGSDEHKNEKEGYRVAPLYRIHANPRETKSGRGSRVCHAPPPLENCFSEGRKMVHSVAFCHFWI